METLNVPNGGLNDLKMDFDPKNGTYYYVQSTKYVQATTLNDGQHSLAGCCGHVALSTCGDVEQAHTRVEVEFNPLVVLSLPTSTTSEISKL